MLIEVRGFCVGRADLAALINSTGEHIAEQAGSDLPEFGNYRLRLCNRRIHYPQDAANF